MLYNKSKIFSRLTIRMFVASSLILHMPDEGSPDYWYCRAIHTLLMGNHHDLQSSTPGPRTMARLHAMNWYYKSRQSVNMSWLQVSCRELFRTRSRVRRSTRMWCTSSFVRISFFWAVWKWATKKENRQEERVQLRPWDKRSNGSGIGSGDGDLKIAWGVQAYDANGSSDSVSGLRRRVRILVSL